MALEKVKTEMKGATSRWARRHIAKKSARKHRRSKDKKEIAYQLKNY